MKTARTTKRFISLLLIIMLLMSLTLPVMATNDKSSGGITWEKVDNDTVKADLPAKAADDTDSDAPEYADTDIVRVSIVLEQKSTVAAGFSTIKIASNASAMSYRSGLKSQQDALAKTISDKVLGGKDLDVVWNLTLAANIISANVPYGTIEQIKALDGVKNVVIEQTYEPCVSSSGAADPNMATSSVMTGSSAAWANGYTGAGSRIAIIDTGLDTDHQSFASNAYLFALEQNAEKLGMDYNEYVKSLALLTQADVEKHWSELNFSSVYSGDVANTFFSEKVPFGANYVDKGIEITHDKDTQGEHGSHVAGIAAANRFIENEDGTFSNALESVKTQGIAPDAQLLVMKVFGKNGGANDSDYMAAIEDAIILGADSVNLSLGSSNAGFATSEDYQNVMDDLAKSDTVVSISAGNSGMYGDGNLPYGYLYSDDANFATGGSPGSFTNAFTVASVDNDGATGKYLKFGDNLIFYTESDYSNDPISSMPGEYEYVFVDAAGTQADFEKVKDALDGKIAICWRGGISFYEKAENAVANGAIATIVANNTSGTINMDLSDYTKSAPCISILQSEGQYIMENSTPVEDESGNVLYYTGKITVEDKIGTVQYDSDYYTMSDFSSWGVPGTLELKPEITAPGGSIYSVNGAVAGGKAYEVMSGTSMAAPQIAGMSALLAQYIRESGLDQKTGLSARQLTQSLLMSTATPLVEKDSGSYYSVMKQGAGLANVDAAMNADSYIMMASDATKSAADGKIKAELGDDPDRSGSYSFSFTINNMSGETKNYDISSSFFTQDIFADEDVGASFLDTWTVPLNFTASYTVNGAAITNDDVDKLAAYDFDGNGSINAADGQALLNYITGVKDSISCKDAADIDNDGDIDTYDAYLFFKALNAGSVSVPANGSVEVTVSVQLQNIADFDDNGAYVEGYVFVDELTSADGALGESHSIPVLGYYGSWSEPSMFDVGSYLEYAYGLEDRIPYMYAAADQDALYYQTYIVNYAGDSANYYFGGNPVAEEDVYMPERNAINSENGDKIGKITFTPIRNAGASRFTVTDEAGNYIVNEELGSVSAAFYYTNGASWQSTKLSYAPNFVPSGIAEGTKLEMKLTLAPEYYVGSDGSVAWDKLSENASFTMPVVIDNTAPEIQDIALVKSFKTGETTIDVTASDNQYIAGVFLYDSESNFIAGYGSDSTAEAGQLCKYSLSMGEADKYLIQVYDYAANCSTYKINLNDEEANGEIAVSLDKTSLELVKGANVKLTASVTPWGTPDETVTWSSSDDSIATVNKYGVVTAVGKGSCTVTATSNGDSTKSASCDVSVITLPLLVQGVLQDKNGNPQFFSWDLEKEATWTPGAALQTDISSFVWDWNGNDGAYGYQMNTDGYLYTVDMETGETVASSDAPNNFGAPLNDMEMSYALNDSLGKNYILGVYDNYVLFSDAADNDFSNGYDFAGDLAQTGASAFTGIAWIGQYSYQGIIFDVYYLLDNANYLWTFGFNVEEGYRLSFGDPSPVDFDLSWPTYDGSQYCSLILGDDGEAAYLSYFTGETNELYRIIESEGEDGNYSAAATLLGDVGADVWPCALISVSPTDSGDGTTATADKVFKTDAKATLSSVKAGEVSFKGKVPVGGLNSVVVSEDESAAPVVKGATPFSVGSASSDEKTVTVEITAKDAKGEDAASTNGLIEVAYSDALELAGVEVYSDYSSVNKGDTVVIGYVDLDGIAAGETVAKLTFNVKSTDDASVTVTHKQLNNEAIEAVEELDITAEFTHENTEVRDAKPATCTEDGYTGDIYCADCGKLLKKGTVIPANHDSDPFNDIAESGYHDYIIEASELGIAKGCADGSYKPNQAITRAQFVTMLWRAAGAPEPEKSEIDFNDAEYIAEPFTAAVAWGIENGIVAGYTDDSFKPDQPISRAQMATFVYRYMKNVAEYDFGEVKAAEFDDAAEIAAPFVDAVNALVSAGIVKGVTANTFDPNGAAVRGAAAAVLVRMVHLLTPTV